MEISVNRTIQNKPLNEYILTTHAIMRAVERLRVDAAIAEDYVQHLLSTAIDQGIIGNARVYLHQKTNVRILTALDEPVVITVYDDKDDADRVTTITNTRLRIALEKELAAIINDAKVDMDRLARHLDRLAQQTLVLEIESHCCKSDSAYQTMQTMIENNMISKQNIENEIFESMAAVERADAEIRSLCA